MNHFGSSLASPWLQLKARVSLRCASNTGMTPVCNLSQPLILENGELIAVQNYSTSVALAGLPVWGIKFKVTITFLFSLSFYLTSIT